MLLCDICCAIVFRRRTAVILITWKTSLSWHAKLGDPVKLTVEAQWPSWFTATRSTTRAPSPYVGVPRRSRIGMLWWVICLIFRHFCLFTGWWIRTVSGNECWWRSMHTGIYSSEGCHWTDYRWLYACLGSSLSFTCSVLSCQQRTKKSVAHLKTKGDLVDINKHYRHNFHMRKPSLRKFIRPMRVRVNQLLHMRPAAWFLNLNIISN